MKNIKQKYEKHRKRAFTTAEAFVALAIISIVIAASVPMVTVKQKQGISSDAQNQTWGVSAIATGKGLLTENPIIIGTGQNQLPNINSYTIDNSGTLAQGTAMNVSLSYYMTNDTTQNIPIIYPGSLLNMITSERPMFRVGSYDFAQIRDNIFIVSDDTANQNVTNIPNTFDPHPTVNNATTCFNTSDCARNIFIGGANFNDSSANNILRYATNFSDNTIIGAENQNIPTTSARSLISGFKNNIGNFSGVTIVGNENTATAANQVIIGNGITPAAPADLINIGNDDNHAPLIAANATTVTFNKPTIVDGIINANGITVTSDERLKNIKGEYKKGLNEVLKVEPILYTLKSDTTNEIQVGVIAQELQKIFPEAVVTMPNGFLGVDVTPVFFATLNAIKELNEKTQYEKERTKRLKAEYLALTGGEQKVSFGKKIKVFFVKIKNKLHI